MSNTRGTRQKFKWKFQTRYLNVVYTSRARGRVYMPGRSQTMWKIQLEAMARNGFALRVQFDIQVFSRIFILIENIHLHVTPSITNRRKHSHPFYLPSWSMDKCLSFSIFGWRGMGYWGRGQLFVGVCNRCHEFSFAYRVCLSLSLSMGGDKGRCHMEP